MHRNVMLCFRSSKEKAELQARVLRQPLRAYEDSLLTCTGSKMRGKRDAQKKLQMLAQKSFCIVEKRCKKRFWKCKKGV